MRRILKPAWLTAPVGVCLFAMAGGGVGEANWLGMTVDHLDKADSAQMGIPTDVGEVVVVKVEKQALSSGVITGDIILGINGQPISSVQDFLDAGAAVMTSAKGTGVEPDVLLSLNRFGRPLMLTIPGAWLGGNTN